MVIFPSGEGSAEESFFHQKMLFLGKKCPKKLQKRAKKIFLGQKAEKMIAQKKHARGRNPVWTLRRSGAALKRLSGIPLRVCKMWTRFCDEGPGLFGDLRCGVKINSIQGTLGKGLAPSLCALFQDRNALKWGGFTVSK